MAIIFVTGIDTDIGKSYATGAIAKTLIDAGHKVLTQKLVETGCGIKNGIRFSKDLLVHEQCVGKAFNTEAAELHAPYLFEYPASPHLSAAKENQYIDTEHLKASIKALAERCDHLIIEGAGGLCVPLNDDITMGEFIAEMGLNTFLVTSPRLGSINHTMLSLHYCMEKNIHVRSLIYNLFEQQDSIIIDETRRILQDFLLKQHQETPSLAPDKTPPLWQELDNLNLSANHNEILNHLN